MGPLLFLAARAGGDVVDYMKKYKVNPIKNMLVPFVQVKLTANYINYSSIV